MNISDHCLAIRGRAYTRWKKYQHAKRLAVYLNMGCTLTYYPQFALWGVTYPEGKEINEIDVLIEMLKS